MKEFRVLECRRNDELFGSERGLFTFHCFGFSALTGAWWGWDDGQHCQLAKLGIKSVNLEPNEIASVVPPKIRLAVAVLII